MSIALNGNERGKLSKLSVNLCHWFASIEFAPTTQIIVLCAEMRVETAESVFANVGMVHIWICDVSFCRFMSHISITSNVIFVLFGFFLSASCKNVAFVLDFGRSTKLSFIYVHFARHFWFESCDSINSAMCLCVYYCSPSLNMLFIHWKSALDFQWARLAYDQCWMI